MAVPKITDIDPDGIYNPEEASYFLRITEEVTKRKLREGRLKGNKQDGLWRILGRDIISHITGE